MQKKRMMDLQIYGKMPPQAIDLEEFVIGAILVDGKLVVEVKEVLKVEDFYKESSQILFNAICDVAENSFVDIQLVAQYLKNNGQIEIVGGLFYVMQLTNKVVSTVNVKNYCYIIKQKSISRSLITLSGDILNKSYDDEEDVFDVLDEAENKIKHINNEISEIKVTPLSNVAMNIIERFDTKVYNAKNNIVNENEIFTGFEEWDKINGSLFNGLYIVAGRPAMGKGVHLTELACRMGKKHDVGIINAEMSNEQLLTRIGCNLKNIDNFLWKKNPLYITEEEQQLVKDAMEEALMLKLHVDNSRHIHKIANKIRLWVDKYKVKVVLIDFLTLLKVREEQKRYMTDTQEVNYVLNVLFDLCKNCKIPIILYVQMNREILGRHGKKEPNLADLKQSGSIEELAYQVSFLHRPEYYDQDNLVDEMGESTKDLMYQIIAKHRDGENARLKHRAVLKCSQLRRWEGDTITSQLPPNFKPVQEMPF